MPEYPNPRAMFKGLAQRAAKQGIILQSDVREVTASLNTRLAIAKAKHTSGNNAPNRK